MLLRHCRAAAAAVVACAAVLSAAPARAAAPPDDRFIAGYAAAVLEREFGLGGAAVSVQGGVITVVAPELDADMRARLAAALADVPGAIRVEISDAAAPAAAAPTAAAEAAAGPEILPRVKLFEPLRADPRWPHFSAAYRIALDDPDVEQIGAASFGETFTLLRGKAPSGRWELGIQGGVFAIFDMESESKDLINADYFIAIPAAYEHGAFSAMARVLHQSSHLGDEFLLRDSTAQANRVNLSYEAIDLLLSYDIGKAWRAYGGGGYLFHREPASLDPWATQAGIEFESEYEIARGLTPVAAFDLQMREESDWSPDYSARAGLQLRNPRFLAERLEFTAEYYNGRNPNGQFYTRDLEYFGFGVHAYFN